MRIRFKKVMAGAVLLGLAAAPARADRIPYLDPIGVPGAGLHPDPVLRLHAGIAWLRAYALHALPAVPAIPALPEAKPVKEVLVSRGGPRMEAIDVPDAVRHQLRSLAGAGMEILAEGEGRYSRGSVREALHSLDFAPGLASLAAPGFGSAPGRGWSVAPEEPLMETAAVPEPATLGLMALGLLGLGLAVRRRQA